MNQLKGTISALEKEKARAETLLRVSASSPIAAEDLAKVNAELRDRKALLDAMHTKYLRLTDGAAGAGRGLVNLPFEPGRPDLKIPDDDAKKRKLTPGLAGGTEIEIAAREHDALLAEQLAGIEATRTHGLELMADQINATSDANQRLNDVLQKMLDATPTAQLEKTREQMQFLARAFEEGKISAEQFNEAAQAALGTLPDKFKDAASEWDEFTKQAARNIQDALGDTVFNTLSGKFDDIGKHWADVLRRMVSEALAAQLGKAVLGDFAKTGEVGGWAGTLLNGLKLSGSVPSYDVGTPYVPRDTLALVHRGERITPAAQNRGGGTPIQQTIYIDSRTDAAQVAQIAASASKEAVREYHAQRVAQGASI